MKKIIIAVVGSNFDQIGSWIYHYGVKNNRVKYIKVSRLRHTEGLNIDSFVLTNSTPFIKDQKTVTEIINNLRLSVAFK